MKSYITVYLLRGFFHLHEFDQVKLQNFGLFVWLLDVN